MVALLCATMLCADTLVCDSVYVYDDTYHYEKTCDVIAKKKNVQKLSLDFCKTFDYKECDICEYTEVADTTANDTIEKNSDFVERVGVSIEVGTIYNMDGLSVTTVGVAGTIKHIYYDLGFSANGFMNLKKSKRDSYKQVGYLHGGYRFNFKRIGVTPIAGMYSSKVVDNRNLLDEKGNYDSTKGTKGDIIRHTYFDAGVVLDYHTPNSHKYHYKWSLRATLHGISFNLGICFTNEKLLKKKPFFSKFGFGSLFNTF